jgi:hypothetical protein
LHIERQRKVRADKQSMKLVAGQQRIASRDWDRQRRWEKQQHDLIDMESMRVRMERKFEGDVGTKGSLETLRGIARQYGIDIDELRERRSRTAGPSSRAGKRPMSS